MIVYGFIDVIRHRKIDVSYDLFNFFYNLSVKPLSQNDSDFRAKSIIGEIFNNIFDYIFEASVALIRTLGKLFWGWFSYDDMRKMLKEKNFYDTIKNVHGKGIKHQYEKIDRHKEKLVIDNTTGLTWQQSGSEQSMNYGEAKRYIRELNRQQFAGHKKWRLPTLEEAMSLVEPRGDKPYIFSNDLEISMKEQEETADDLCIDTMFDNKQGFIWTKTKMSSDEIWVIDFKYGCCNHSLVRNKYYVRAVRREK
jgi:serine/threonine-protein kinase